jgi:hypothetical protein
MKQALRFSLSAIIVASVGFGSVGTAQAVTPTTKVHVAIPKSLFNPVATRSWAVSVQALVARILKEECQVFPAFCAFIPPRLTTPSTTVPPAMVSTTTTVVPPPTTVTSVPTTVTTTVPTVITLPVIVIPVPLAVPASSGGTSTCTVTMTGGGVSQCIQSASVSSSS